MRGQYFHGDRQLQTIKSQNLSSSTLLHKQVTKFEIESCRIELKIGGDVDYEVLNEHKKYFFEIRIFVGVLVADWSIIKWPILPIPTFFAKFHLFIHIILTESFKKLFLTIFQICKLADFRHPTLT